jgi:predicted nucleotide-binding protein
MEAGIGRLQARINELSAFDVASVPKGSSPQLTALSAAIDDTLVRCFGDNTSRYKRFIRAAELQLVPVMFSKNYPLQHHYQETTKRNISEAIALLTEAQRTLREDLRDAKFIPSQRIPLSKPILPSNKVFVVHGHDEAAKQGLARFLEKIGLEAVVLSEQPDQGRTIIEKFEECAEQVGFAVVLLTPDDIGNSVSSGIQEVRTRQNVLFELGYFAGKLGRGRTCLLRKGDVEIPSDLYGLIYTNLDPDDGWKMKLVKEMKAAGLDFDSNKLWD